MRPIDEILAEIEEELLHLKIKKEYHYYAREFNKRANNIIKNDISAHDVPLTQNGSNTKRSDVKHG